MSLLKQEKDPTRWVMCNMVWTPSLISSLYLPQAAGHIHELIHNIQSLHTPVHFQMDSIKDEFCQEIDLHL